MSPIILQIYVLMPSSGLDMYSARVVATRIVFVESIESPLVSVLVSFLLRRHYLCVQSDIAYALYW